jgi:hypothetical protein
MSLLGRLCSLLEQTQDMSLLGQDFDGDPIQGRYDNKEEYQKAMDKARKWVEKLLIRALGDKMKDLLRLAKKFPPQKTKNMKKYINDMRDKLEGELLSANKPLIDGLVEKPWLAELITNITFRPVMKKNAKGKMVPTGQDEILYTTKSDKTRESSQAKRATFKPMVSIPKWFDPFRQMQWYPSEQELADAGIVLAFHGHFKAGKKEDAGDALPFKKITQALAGVDSKGWDKNIDSLFWFEPEVLDRLETGKPVKRAGKSIKIGDSGLYEYELEGELVKNDEMGNQKVFADGKPMFANLKLKVVPSQKVPAKSATGDDTVREVPGVKMKATFKFGGQPFVIERDVPGANTNRDPLIVNAFKDMYQEFVEKAEKIVAQYEMILAMDDAQAKKSAAKQLPPELTKKVSKKTAMKKASNEGLLESLKSLLG